MTRATWACSGGVCMASLPTRPSIHERSWTTSTSNLRRVWKLSIRSPCPHGSQQLSRLAGEPYRPVQQMYRRLVGSIVSLPDLGTRWTRRSQQLALRRVMDCFRLTAHSLSVLRRDDPGFHFYIVVQP